MSSAKRSSSGKKRPRLPGGFASERICGLVLLTEKSTAYLDLRDLGCCYMGLSLVDSLPLIGYKKAHKSWILGTIWRLLDDMASRGISPAWSVIHGSLSKMPKKQLDSPTRFSEEDLSVLCKQLLLSLTQVQSYFKKRKRKDGSYTKIGKDMICGPQSSSVQSRKKT